MFTAPEIVCRLCAECENIISMPGIILQDQNQSLERIVRSSLKVPKT